MLSHASKPYLSGGARWANISLPSVKTKKPWIAQCSRQIHRKFPQEDPNVHKKTRSTFNYVTAVGVIAVGLTYAAVPLYRMFCQVLFGFYSNSITLHHIVIAYVCCKFLISSNINEVQQNSNFILM